MNYQESLNDKKKKDFKIDLNEADNMNEISNRLDK